MLFILRYVPDACLEAGTWTKVACAGLGGGVEVLWAGLMRAIEGGWNGQGIKSLPVPGRLIGSQARLLLLRLQHVELGFLSQTSGRSRAQAQTSPTAPLRPQTARPRERASS